MLKKLDAYLSELEVAGRDKAWNIRQAVIAASHASYRYTATLGDKNKAKNDDSGLKSLAIAGDDATALAQGVAIAEGVEFARGLGNLPANICNPAYIAEQARKFAPDHGTESEILDEKQMEAPGLGPLLPVGPGPAHRPPPVVRPWNGGGAATP